MPRPLVATDMQGQERQHRTILANAVNDLLKVMPPHEQTTYELEAGVTPLDIRYAPGNAFRYMTEEQQNSVRSFDYVEDVTEPLRNCLLANHKHDVFLPSGGYKITGSLPVYNQNIRGSAKEYVVIKPSAASGGNDNFECFVNSGVEFIQGSIQQITILYNNGVQPTNFATDGNKIGIFFATVGGRSPNFFHIQDVVVRGGWWCYYDSSGSYAGTLERVFAQECQKGFYKSTGTTFRFSECICLNVNEAFTMTHHLGLTMSCCAQDGADLVAGNAANTFDDCAGLVITGWDSEGNDITGNGSRLFYFKDSEFTFTGFTGYLNTMSNSAGEQVSLFDVDNSNGSFFGCRPTYTAGSLAYTGGGVCTTLLARNAARVFIAGSDMSAPTGGAPSVRYALQATGTARVHYVATEFASGNFAASFEVIRDTGTNTGTLTGVTGAAVTGSVIYTRNGNQVTLFFPDLTGPASAIDTTCTITGAIPSSIYPARNQLIGGIRIQDNSVRAFGLIVIGTGGTITLYPSAAAGAWNAAGTKGLESCTVTYSLD